MKTQILLLSVLLFFKAHGGVEPVERSRSPPVDRPNFETQSVNELPTGPSSGFGSGLDHVLDDRPPPDGRDSQRRTFPVQLIPRQIEYARPLPSHSRLQPETLPSVGVSDLVSQLLFTEDSDDRLFHARRRGANQLPSRPIEDPRPLPDGLRIQFGTLPREGDPPPIRRPLNDDSLLERDVERPRPLSRAASSSGEEVRR